jgi:hypothetical protein
MNESIINEINKIRRIINEPRKQHDLLQRRRDWSKLCTCLDTIDDVETSISSYLELADFDACNGGYLFIYGLLQGLFIEQDAISHLYNSIFETDDYLKQMLSKYKALQDIREIRNNSIGHPTNRKGKAFYSIVQTSICKQGFDLLSDIEEGKTYFSSINLIEIIELQSQEILTNLQVIVGKLEEEIRMHKEKYKEDKFGSLFHLRGYCIEKLSRCTYVEGTYNGNVDIAFSQLKGLQENYNKFYTKTTERFGHVIDAIGYLHPKIAHVFSRMWLFKEQGMFNNYDAIVMIDALREYLQEAEEIANEIDEDCNNNNFT